ncbi:inovirus-type Gp2 protein [Vibrio vulnificus]|nr:inovirus-type Gp2 protein [Vibrio vulnificus]
MNNNAEQSYAMTGFYQGYQINIDHGALSMPLVANLYSTYQSMIRRFPHSFAYRFRLRIPNEQKKQAKTLINQWFYRLCHYRPKDELSLIWQQETTRTGAISYRITLFINAAPYPTYANKEKVKKWLVRSIRRSWAKTIGVSPSDGELFCIFTPDPLLVLNTNFEDYNEQIRFLFFIISRYAKSPSDPNTFESNLMGSFTSRARKATKSAQQDFTVKR